MLELYKEQRDFLKDVVSGDWTVNPDTGLIDVDGNVTIFQEKPIENGRLPVSFGKVTGFFNASDARLITLEGCPYWVGCDVILSSNRIKTLNHAPKYIGGNYSI